MIAYTIMLLTEIADIKEAPHIAIQCGTEELHICGDIVRAFVRCTNHAYHDYPFDDCLGYGLELIPPELRSVFAYLYETLKETIVWNEESQF